MIEVIEVRFNDYYNKEVMMVLDKGKVINGLKCIKGDLVLCVDCAYSDENGHGGYHCKAFCAKDAIELLKDQDQEIESLRQTAQSMMEGIVVSQQDTVEHALDVLRKHGWKEDRQHDPIIVRCLDCEHVYFASNRAPNEQCYACGKYGVDVAPDWFCADGERRDT